MCGIAGFLGSYDSIVLEKMSNSIAHRGPDDAGSWHDFQFGVGLAHRRLSIIDLSSAGHQPMWDASHQAIITFNGEIYNYRELRKSLIQDGYRFVGATDTEVILNLYLRDGLDFLKQLNGIFAFALWDEKKHKLLIARDGMGVKPFYYAVTNNGFVFASEIKSLLQVYDLDTELDAQALIYYVGYLYAPGPHTPIKAVRKLLPGHAAWVSDQGIESLWCFYRLPYDQPIVPIDQAAAAEALRQHLDQAVQRQMVADVPVGAFLSGGLDSSSVVALARKHTPDRKIECFTIGIKGSFVSDEGMIDDLPYARRIARHLGVPLRVISVDADRMAHRLEEMIWHLDEPQADPAPMNVLFICELARQHGIKVLLSGAGGDDIFSGYRRHHALMLEQYWSWLPASARQRLQIFANQMSINLAWERRFAKVFQYADQTPQRRLASYFLWTTPQWLKRLAGERLRDEWSRSDPLSPLLCLLNNLPADTHPLNQMLALDSSFFLTDHNLNYTDKMSMATGVEVRVPFLDPDMVAFAASLPPEFKQHGATGKWIFKKAMEPILPREVIYRPKTGFGAPLRRWLKHDLKPMADDLLDEATLRRRGLFDPPAVKRLREMDQIGRIDAGYSIFAMMCIEIWCRLFVDNKRNPDFSASFHKPDISC